MTTIYLTMVGDGAEDELRSFYRWLLGEDEVRHNATLVLEGSPPDVGEMGSTLEAIKLVTESGFAIANLALTYLTFRATRPRKTKMTVEREGTRVTITEDVDSAEVERIFRALDPGSQ